MFSFTTNPTVNIVFNEQDSRQKKTFKVQGSDPVELTVFSGFESVTGVIDISLPPGKKIEHQGIRVELIGQTELYFERGNSNKFLSLVREIESAGTMTTSKTYPFEFSVEKPYESYSGLNVRLRYFLRVTITRSYNNFTKEQDFAVLNYVSQQNQQLAQAATTDNADANTANNAVVPVQGIKMEVGIEDCLHIEFEFDKQKYHLQDVILGKIYFLLVRIKIKLMEIAVIRREAAGAGANSYNESETLIKFELMDGAPIKGECVPIRLFLSALELTPTYRSINHVFSVKYYLNLVLIDEEDRRYFKQQEVIFWRKHSNEIAAEAESDGAENGHNRRGLRSAPDRMVNV